MTLDARFDLAALARGRTKRAQIVLRPIPVRLAFEEQLSRILNRVLKAYERAKPDLLASARAARTSLTADAFGFGDAVGALRSSLSQAVAVARMPLERAFASEALRHDADWVSRVKNGTGVDLAAVVSASGTAGTVTLAAARATALIQGLADETAKRVEAGVLDLIGRGRATVQAVSDLLTKITRYGRGRASFIATDLAGSFSSALDHLRHEQAGITAYQWTTMLDSRVRPHHAEREGVIFEWDRPPSDGHPGQPTNCRCVAAAVLAIKPRSALAVRSQRARARKAGTEAVAAALGLTL